MEAMHERPRETVNEGIPLLFRTGYHKLSNIRHIGGRHGAQAPPR